MIGPLWWWNLVILSFDTILRSRVILELFVLDNCLWLRSRGLFFDINIFRNLLQYVLIVFIGFQEALCVTETNHRHIENDEAHHLLTDFTLALKVKNFENMLV